MTVGRVVPSSKPFPAVPHMVPMSPLVPAKSTSRATVAQHHATDNKFAFSKVFQTRYNSAATAIQKFVRMVQAKRILGELQLNAHIIAEERRLQQERLRRRVEAAVQIQAVVRSWRVRLHWRVFQLESELQRIERARQRDLVAIAEWKEAKRQAIDKKYKAQRDKADAQDRLHKETLDKANEVIAYLRKVNARQRVKNDTLKAAIDQLLAENQMLNEEAARYANFREITDSMSKACTNKNVLLSVLEEFEQKKLAMESAIERRDDRIMFENRVGRLYFNAIRSVTLVLETSCTDEKLVYAVEAMCLELEDKGHGLDASEYENSGPIRY